MILKAAVTSIAISLMIASASASITLTNTPFVGTDSIDWASFGAPLTPVPTGTTGTTVGGSPYILGVENGTAYTNIQGNGGGEWHGYFPLQGDRLLTTSDPATKAIGSGPLDITFTGGSYSALGFYIDPDFFFPVTFEFRLYNSGGIQIGVFDFNDPNGFPAQFVGFASTSNDLAAISISGLTGTNPNNFAIDGVQLTGGSSSSTPSPAAFLPFAAGVVGAARRRRAK